MNKQKSRPFLISCGLKDGYEPPEQIHGIEKTCEIVRQWIENRTKAGEKVLVGALFSGVYIYPWIVDENATLKFEPAFHYRGMARKHASNAEAEEMLHDLARDLSKRQNQNEFTANIAQNILLLRTNNENYGISY